MAKIPTLIEPILETESHNYELYRVRTNGVTLAEGTTTLEILNDLYGDMYAMLSETNPMSDFRLKWTNFTNSEQVNLDAIYKAYSSEYNPIENYSMTETGKDNSVVKNTGTVANVKSENISGTDATTTENTDTTTYGKNVTTENNNTNTTKYGKVDTQSGTDTTTTTYGKVNTLGGSDTLTDTIAEKDKNSGSDINVISESHKTVDSGNDSVKTDYGKNTLHKTTSYDDETLRNEYSDGDSGTDTNTTTYGKTSNLTDTGNNQLTFGKIVDRTGENTHSTKYGRTDTNSGKDAVDLKHGLTDTLSGSDVVTNGGTETVANSGDDKLVSKGNVSRETSNTTQSNDTRTDNLQNTSDATHELKRSGNIGVTTSQQMIDSELQLRKYNVLYNYLRRFAIAYLFYI